MELPVFKQKFNPVYASYCKQMVIEAQDKLPDAELKRIIRHTEHIANGGSRARAYLAWLMYKTAGGKSARAAFKLGAVCELLQLFLLMQDDVMDEDDYRRGVPTIHHFTEKVYAKRVDSKKARKRGESQAIILGDYLWLEATTLFQQLTNTSSTPQDMWDSWNTMMSDVLLGQMIDVHVTTQSRITSVALTQKNLLKTASYTLLGPLRLGAALAGKLPKWEKFITDFGTACGHVYQIQNDLKDVLSPNPERPLLSDLRQGQHTLLTQYIFTKGTSAQKKQLTLWFGNPKAKAAPRQVRDLFTQSGAVKFVEADVKRALQKARAAVETANMPATWRTKWEAVINLLEVRS